MHEGPPGEAGLRDFLVDGIVGRPTGRTTVGYSTYSIVSSRVWTMGISRF